MILKIYKEHDINILMQRAKKYFATCGLSQIQLVELTTIISELGYNIIKYAGCGSIELGIDNKIITIIASDKGNGFVDITNAIKEGYSSSGTLGLGLGTVIRISDEFYIETSNNGSKITVIKGIN